MKILWFTNTPSLFSQGNQGAHSGGWIESLEAIIRKENDIELAVAFLHPSCNGKTVIDGRLYYPILKKSLKKSPLKWLVNNHFSRIENEELYVRKMLDIVNDYNPDVIHIFGTEGIFGSIINHTKVPVVIHLQGLINPIYNAYYPTSVSNKSFSGIKFIKDQILGTTIKNGNKRFGKMAEREAKYFKAAKYLMGRTDWDMQVSSILAPQAKYFHVDEILRPAFYDRQKTIYLKGNPVKIISTISPTTYKGIDVILKTAALLKNKTNIDFIWKIAGIDNTNRILRLFENEFKISHAQNNIEFVGRKSPNDLINIMCESDIFVHPSYIDNSPNSVCEAQMLGLPVVACNTGGLSSLIENGKNGVLIPANGVYELAFVVKDYAESPEKYFQMGSNARELALLRHDREIAFATLKKMYLKLTL